MKYHQFWVLSLLVIVALGRETTDFWKQQLNKTEADFQAFAGTFEAMQGIKK